MIKKLLLTFVISAVALGLFIAVYAAFFLKETTAPAPQVKVKPEAAKPWTGEATKTVDTTFIRSGQPIGIQDIAFDGLKTAKSNLTVTMIVQAKNGKLPAWVSKKSFRARSTDAQSFKTESTSELSGSTYILKTTIKDIPTTYLGDVGVKCQNIQKQDQFIFLTIQGPDSPFSVRLDAPTAPAGSCLGMESTPVEIPETQSKEPKAKTTAVKPKKIS